MSIFDKFKKTVQTAINESAAECFFVGEMTLTLTGMRGEWVYQFDGDTEALRRCRVVYSNGEDELVPEASMFCSKQTMLDLFSACEIHRWNGFHGEHPRHVQDGIMFRFEAAVNGGQTICADGSANYPRGYHDFVRTMDEMLAEHDMTEASNRNNQNHGEEMVR